MARAGRVISKSGIYHVLLRGQERLFRSERDYQQFTYLLKEYFTDDSLIGYVLGADRIHLVVKTETLSLLMKPLCTAYARYYNRVYALEGKLFYDRFRSEPVEEDDDLKGILSYFLFKKGRESVEVWVKSAYRACRRRYLPMDDYEHISKTELSEIVEWFCDLPCTEENANLIFQKIRQNNRIRIGLVQELFGAAIPQEKKPAVKKTEKKKPAKKPATKKAAEKKPEPKPEPPKAEEPVQEEKPKPKKQLSVWLL